MVLRWRQAPTTTPSLPARFGHRTAPSGLILTRVRGDSPGRSSGGSVGDRDEPRAIAGLIYSACDEKRSVPNAWREIPVGRQSRDFRTDEALVGSIAAISAALTSAIRPKIGRASCRERV